MAICMNIFGFFYALTQAILILLFLLVMVPVVVIKIWMRFKLESVNWIIILAWMYTCIGWYAGTNKYYHDFLLNYLPRLTCGFVF